MKTFFPSLLLSLMSWVALAGSAAAQTNLAGKWQGTLEIAPGQVMRIHFEFTKAAGGEYSAVVTSPDPGAIKNVSAKSVKFADNKLAVDVPSLSGGYAGTLRDDAFVGEWTQEGAKLPLTLKPFAAPTLTKADIDALRGEWSGPFKAMGLDVTIVLRFSTGPDGALRGVLDVPEQGVKDWPGSDIKLDDGYFHFEQERARVVIRGTLKGDQMVGEWNQLGNSTPLTLKKGKYVAAAKYLDIPAAARDQVKGKWSGTLGPLTVVARFETDAQGRMLGYFDSPTQNLPNIPITEAKLEGTKFSFGIAGFGGKYTGELAGDKLTGEWIQLGMPKAAPLTFTREK